MLNVCDFIQVYVFTTNHHLNLLFILGIYVIGSHIRANVVIQDIWCSNGILHITDNILHIPTRTVKDEIQLRPSLS